MFDIIGIAGNVDRAAVRLRRIPVHGHSIGRVRARSSRCEERVAGDESIAADPDHAGLSAPASAPAA